MQEIQRNPAGIRIAEIGGFGHPAVSCATVSGRVI
jgi:hypothetical protein